MKTITLEKVYRSLRDMVYEVRVPTNVADKARLSITRMLEIAKGAARSLDRIEYSGIR